MSTWYIPVLILILLAMIVWDLRKVGSEGVVYLAMHEASRAERPTLFAWLIFVNLFGLIAVVATFGMWVQSEMLS